MARIFLDMAMSLDGYVAGPDGQDGGLHDWYFAPAAPSAAVIDELLTMIGAMILGRRSYGDSPDGFDTPYKVPHIVLTHAPRPGFERDGASFQFVSSGIEDALAQAQASAGGKDICVAGGASTAQQYLSAGLIDEMQIHLVPKVLGGGLRLLDTLPPRDLEVTRVIESTGVTHLRYRILR
jgi:dihydrofolate reductase